MRRPWYRHWTHACYQSGWSLSDAENKFVAWQCLPGRQWPQRDGTWLVEAIHPKPQLGNLCRPGCLRSMYDQTLCRRHLRSSWTKHHHARNSWIFWIFLSYHTWYKCCLPTDVRSWVFLCERRRHHNTARHTGTTTPPITHHAGPSNLPPKCTDSGGRRTRCTWSSSDPRGR